MNLARHRADYAGTIEVAESLITDARKLEDPHFEEYALYNKGLALVAKGEPAAAIGVLEVAIEHARRIADREHERNAMATLALACAVTGDPRAHEMALAAAQEIDAPHTETLWQAARALHILGRDAEAERFLRHAYREYSRLAAMLTHDDDMRAFADLPWNAGVLRAVREDAWPDDNSPSTTRASRAPLRMSGAFAQDDSAV